MNFFNNSVPPLRRKQATLETYRLQGFWQVSWQIGNRQLYSNFYTRLDQCFLLWGLAIAPMFVTAQFFPISWHLQAILWSILSIFGTVGMVYWTHYWVKERQVCWILYCWVVLMLSGVVVTDLGVFFGWGEILLNLCPIWLGLCSFGYFCTGLAIRSRTLLFTSVIHLLGILSLPYVGGLQFLLTGAVMFFCLFLLAELEWDHC
ncbi:MULTISPECIES: hypothetical protein [Nostocales]|uniref:Integral membrane protein n=3 Tax=Nostocales TaxID=1161 RepID=A0A0C1N031_9CYAN|nr:hypothetical protein [Tolypothrix bouteillei]KAF3888563.1 hypothetical protein DA73_0400026120 [Tolypothrix bouteillei VB521301]